MSPDPDARNEARSAADPITAILDNLVHVGRQSREVLRAAVIQHAEMAELLTMLVRFRALAMASVTATLAASIEATVEFTLAGYLADSLKASSGK